MRNLVDKDYIINVGPHGTFSKSGKYQTLPKDIDAMFERYENNASRKIALYFHGGLVNEQSGLDCARKIGPLIAEVDVEPVCFVWETGLVETISTNLQKISETKLFNKLLKVLLKKVTQKMGYDTPTGRGIAGKELSYDEIEIELSKPNPFKAYSRSAEPNEARSAINIESLAGQGPFLNAELEREFRILIENDQEFVLAISQTKLTTNANGNSTGARGFISVGVFLVHVTKIAIRIITRFIQKKDHDLYPTIVEEILREFYIAEVGAWVWKSMKDKSSDMWQSNAGRIGLNQFAGRYFLEKLAAYKLLYPETEVNIIGHSAGSIATCNLLKYTAQLENSFSANHIIFMAPACRIELFKKEILDNISRYRDIRIFTMNDKTECDDVLVPYFYTHSLLYLISGILEDEGDSYDANILGLERHIGYILPYNTPNLKEVHTYIYAAGENRICFSVTPQGTANGLSTESTSHGGFDDDSATLKSIQAIIK
ncbi:hypothetical protein [Flavobacterium sp.]|uniref:hypothetical protein n=1 Tax=Flavobacterium sp. TaxID=239 RepID=UPI00391D0694